MHPLFPLDPADQAHRFYHDKIPDMQAWFEAAKAKPQFVLASLHLVSSLRRWDEESKAVRWEDIRYAIQEYVSLRPVDALWRDGQFDPGNKDSTWVQDVAFEHSGQLTLMLRYLDDYRFRQPYWCTHFIALR